MMNDERKKREQAPALHRLARGGTGLGGALVLGLCYLPFAARAAHVRFDLVNFIQGSVTNRRVVLTPLSTPGITNTNIVIGDKLGFTTSSNGTFTASNLVAGLYQVDLSPPPSATRFEVLVPQTNVLLSASALATPATNDTSRLGYSQAEADARFSGQGHGHLTNQPASLNLSNWSSLDTNLLGSAAHGHLTNQPASLNLSNWAVVSPDNYADANTVQGWDDDIYDYADLIGGMLAGYITNFGGFATNLFIQSPTLTGSIRMELAQSNAVLVIDSDGMLASTSVNSDELGYLDGVTSGVQAQINDRVPRNGGHATNLMVYGDANKTNGVYISNAGEVLSNAVGSVTIAGGNITQSAITAPAAPVDGQMWNDSTQKTRQVYEAGVVQNLVGVIFSGTNNPVVTNTVAETTIMPAGVGTTNLPANFWTAGKRICIRASAIVKTPSSQSHTYKVKVGASVWTVTAFGYGTADNTPLGLYIQITCLTAGAAGTVAMCLHGQTGVTTSFYSNASRPATMSQALDTTAATWIDVTITPSATTCSFCVQQLALEVLD